MRTRQVKLRMNDDEYARLHERADRHDLSAADLIRHVVLGREYARKLPDREILKEIAKQLSGIARNINQQTRLLHEANRAGALSDVYFEGALAQLSESETRVSAELKDLKRDLRK